MLVLATLLLLPVSVLAIYKPARVLLPKLFGVSCENKVCIDDFDKRDFAMSLLEAEKQRLETQYNLSIGEPKIIFCSTERCQHTFGLGNKAGFTLGTSGIAISPRGWKEHYVAHELIHFWQAENFGSLVLLNGEPWLIEGMAYALSNDPRTKLHEPFEAYRNTFHKWYRNNLGIPLIKSVGKSIRNP